MKQCSKSVANLASGTIQAYPDETLNAPILEQHSHKSVADLKVGIPKLNWIILVGNPIELMCAVMPLDHLLLLWLKQGLTTLLGIELKPST